MSFVVLADLAPQHLGAAREQLSAENGGTAAAFLDGWFVADSDHDPSTGLPEDHRFTFPEEGRGPLP